MASVELAGRELLDCLLLCRHQHVEEAHLREAAIARELRRPCASARWTGLRRPTRSATRARSRPASSPTSSSSSPAPTTRTSSPEFTVVAALDGPRVPTPCIRPRSRGDIQYGLGLSFRQLLAVRGEQAVAFRCARPAGMALTPNSRRQRRMLRRILFTLVLGFPGAPAGVDRGERRRPPRQRHVLHLGDDLPVRRGGNRNLLRLHDV